MYVRPAGKRAQIPNFNAAGSPYGLTNIHFEKGVPENLAEFVIGKANERLAGGITTSPQQAARLIDDCIRMNLQRLVECGALWRSGLDAREWVFDPGRLLADSTPGGRCPHCGAKAVERNARAGMSTFACGLVVDTNAEEFAVCSNSIDTRGDNG
jgi:hypothetical protein